MQSITEKVSSNSIIYFIFKTSLNLFFLFTRKLIKPLTENTGNVVIIALHKLGDTVFTIPAIRELQKKFQNSNITILCYPEVISIYKQGLTDVNFCDIEHKHFYFNGRCANSKARKKLKATRPEIIIDITGVMTSATLIFNSRANEIMGFNREHFKSIYTHYSPKKEIPHLSKMYLTAIQQYISISDYITGNGFPIQSNPTGSILIQPFAGWKAKEWNFNKFMQLAVKLKDKFNVSLIVPVNIIPADVMVEAIDQKIEIIQTHSIQELIGNIKECSIFIGNDSGPLYIASLLGKPTFAIYGPTNPEYSLPLGHNHSYIRNEINCSPKKNEQYCFTTGGKFGCPAFQCMNQLNLEQVYSELLPFVVKFCSIKENNFENTERKS